MCSVPHAFACFSWNVQQHTRASTQCTSAGVHYDTYLITTVVGFVQQAESSAVVISLQGLCTTTFQLLKRELADRYEKRVVFHFSPHSCPQEHWQAHYESDPAVCGDTAAHNMYGSMVIYLSPREDRDFLLTSKEIVCDSYELDQASSAMPCVCIRHADNTTLQIVCIHLANTETLRTEQQAQLSRVLCAAVSDLTIVTGVLGEGHCMMPGYTDLLAETVAETYPSANPTRALSDSWAVGPMCKGSSVHHASADAIRLLHVEHVSAHLPTSRQISLQA
jgi:hypothetical protein